MKRKCQSCPLCLWFDQLGICCYHLLRKEEHILELKVINSVFGEKLKNISFGRYINMN